MADNTFPLLTALVKRITCKPGWSFALLDDKDALRLVITVVGRDSHDYGSRLAVQHLFPVPMATYNESTWRRWIFECCRGVENHELGEYFMVDGKRPFAPLHGPGENPYMVHEFRDLRAARTRQDGSIMDIEIVSG
jgi:hypothetical protein